MDSHERLLSAFLAGDLDPGAARRWDEHLLECERCWRAVREDRAGRQAAQLLRHPAPPGLADRVAFAVEVAAAARTIAPPSAGAHARSPHQGRGGRRGRRRLAADGLIAAAAAVALIVAVGLIVARVAGGRTTRSMPAAVAAVTRYARAIPPPGLSSRSHPGTPALPVEVGHAVTVLAGGQRIVLRTWRLGGAEVVVAVSGRPFPMPARAEGVPGMGMAWTARLGKLGLYCLNGRTSELVAAPVPFAELAALAARLPLA